MKTQEVVKRYGSKAALARKLDITPQAISQWGDEMPELQVFRLRELEAKSHITSYRIVQDGWPVAWATSMKEIQHYAVVYGQDGPVTIQQLKGRRWVEAKEGGVK